jgi:hypothetical protein
MRSLLQIVYEELKPVNNGGLWDGKKYEKNPSDDQIENDSYRKPRKQWNGLSLALENPKGSYRSGKDSDGTVWKNKMYADYGEIVRTIGNDEDAIDFFMGDNPKSKFVYIIDQKKIDKNSFDEHKVVLGTENENEAKSLYLKNYDKDWLKKQGGQIDGIGMTVDAFKEWLEKHPKMKPAHKVMK